MKKFISWPLALLLVMGFSAQSQAACKKNSGVQVQEYLYDFSVDGGSNSTSITLSNKAGYAPLPTGAIVTAVDYSVLTSVAGTSSTVSWGFTGDEDGYSGTTIAEATLVAGYVSNAWKTSNSVLWDDSNDVQKYKKIASASDGAFIMDISTADLTAGKIMFMVSYLCPSL
jgi:hypothetical protein